MATTVLKVEADAETCCICGGTGGDLMTPEEYDASALPMQVPLRAMLLHLNSNKVVPEGRVCAGCARRVADAYELSCALSAREVPPLSDKIRALRRRLHELTQKIDVFIVVGGAGGAAATYSEDDIIMVDRDALAAAARADDEDLERARNARGDAVYQCSLCPVSFQRVAEYRAHVASHGAGDGAGVAGAAAAGEAAGGAGAHSCWTCGLQFGSQRALREHAREHAPLDLNHCNLCNTTFQSASELRRHETACPSACPACGVRCADRAALGVHVTARHALVCALCFAVSRSAEDASAHRLRHRQARQFVCGHDGCILRFPTRAALMSHIRKCHAGESESDAPASANTCVDCGRTFASAGALKRHARSHRVAAPPSPSPPSQQIVLEESGYSYAEDEDMEHGGVQEVEVEGEEVEYLEVETLDEGEVEGELEDYQYELKPDLSHIE